MSKETEILTFKYEPTTIDEMILSDDIRPKLEKAIVEVPNLILYGKPGVGKGTFVNCLLQATGYDFLKINASDENGVDIMRNKIKSFATSLGISPIKIVYINECLEENQEIQIGSVKSPTNVKMKDLPIGRFALPSMNLETGEIEDDFGTIVSDREAEVFELTLEDGRTVMATAEHPFFVRNTEGKIIEKKLCELSEEDEIITY